MDAVLGRGRIMELDAVAVDSPVGSFDGGDWDILVQGHLVGMRRVKGQRAMVVQGDLLGEEDSYCRVEVAGDVIVTGRIEWAQVIAANILVGESVTHSQLTADSRIRIAHNIDNVDIVAGNFDVVRKQIEACSARIKHARVRAESLGRRVTQDEKRMAKACRALRTPLDFNVGRIVSHADGRVSVDLTSFYESLAERREDQLELALAEFFAKGIVGVVARTNRKYLVDYPSREKVFMQLLRSLRELFLVVVDRDRTVRALKAAETELEILLAGLEVRQPQVEVGGRIAPHVEMEFILPRVVRLPDAGIDFGVPETAALSVHLGASFGELEIGLRDTAGARRAKDAAQLQGVLVHLDDDGRIRWKTVISSKEAEAA